MKKRVHIAVLVFALLALLATPAAEANPPVITASDVTAEATGPDGATVSYSITATSDNGPPTVVCTPAEGSTFPLGTHSVSCTATDPVTLETAPASFNVTVQDTTRPVVTVPGPVTAEATGPSGASVSYSGVSATDTVSGSLIPACDRDSGSTFPLGTTTVTCTATDGAGNTSEPPGKFPVTVQDTTPPVLTVPGPVTAEATSASGAPVSYSVSATDLVSGNVTPICVPEPGSTFPLGTTTVTCSVKDGVGNSAAPGSFPVTVRDTSGPEFENVPADFEVEAGSPRGSLVTYAAPTAVDAVDGPVPSSCDPGSGSTFSLGSTRVVCSATDTRGNAASSSFHIRVADRTAPILTVPAPLTVSSQGAETLPASAAAIAAFLNSAVASDLVDGKLAVTHDAPRVFAVGTKTITFSATDKSGNRSTETSNLTVVKEAVQPTRPLDRTPPENVRGLAAKVADRSVTLSWRPPPDPDFAHVVIGRSTQGAASVESAVYKGPARRFVDRRLTNGVAYRYVVVSYDQAGNRSAGVAIVASPKAALLVSPLSGARVTAPPLLRWVRVPGVAFYNVQLFRGTSRAKIMTAWPVRNQLQLPPTWTYAGRREQLVPGVYRWYVWPGYTTPTARKFGPLLGQSTFTVVAKKKSK